MINTELTLKVKEKINATTERVWKALTSKEEVKSYFWDTNVESTWERGSTIVFSGSYEGHSYRDKGTILDIEKGKHLTYDYWSSMSGIEDIPENYLKVSYDLEHDGESTLLTITQQGAKDETALQHSKEGWSNILKGLKKFVEEN